MSADATPFSRCCCQVATASPSPAACGSRSALLLLRGRDANLSVIVAEVPPAVDLARGVVRWALTSCYDYLTPAAGSTDSYLGPSEWGTRSTLIELKTLDDAVSMRNQTCSASRRRSAPIPMTSAGAT